MPGNSLVEEKETENEAEENNGETAAAPEEQNTDDIGAGNNGTNDGLPPEIENNSLPDESANEDDPADMTTNDHSGNSQGTGEDHSSSHQSDDENDSSGVHRERVRSQDESESGSDSSSGSSSGSSSESSSVSGSDSSSGSSSESDEEEEDEDDPKTKKRVLKEQLVTRHIDRKNTEHDTINQAIASVVHPGAQNNGGNPPAAGGNAPSAPSKGSSAVNDYLKYSGFGLDMANAAIGLGNSTMGFSELYSSSTKPTQTPSNPNPKSDRELLEKKHAPYKTANNYLTLGTTLWGGINNGIGMHLNRKKLSSKNKRAKTAAQIGFSSNFFGMLANASKFTTKGLKLWGDQGDKHTERSTRWMGLLGSTMGLIGSGITFGGSIADKITRKRIVNEANGLSQADNDDSIENQAKGQAAQDKSNNDWNSYVNHKEQLNSIKAQKYAMKHAAEMNSVKANQGPKGIVGTLGGLASTVGSLFNAIPAWADTGFGQFMKAAGGAVSAITNVAKQHEKVSDGIAAVDIKNKKNDIVREYINKKKDKLDTELASFMQRHPNMSAVTDFEKKRIIVGRLGVDLEIENKELTEEYVMKAFDAINHKRALYIMNSDDNTKGQILKTLRLDTNASLQDIESVLKGD